MEITVKKWTDIINKYVSTDFLKYLIISDSEGQELDEDLKNKFQNDYNISKHFLIDVKNIDQVNTAFDEILYEVILNRINKINYA